MALTLTDDELMLRDAAATFLADRASVGDLRRLRDERDANGYDSGVWKEMAELGWLGVVIPEEYGGLDFGYTALGVVVEQMGRQLSPTPFLSTAVVAATAIREGGTEQQKQDLLPAIAQGTRVVSLALQEEAHHAPERIALEAAPCEGGFRLSGEKRLVQDAHIADTFIVAARTSAASGESGGVTLFLVDSTATGLSADRVLMVDSRNSGTVRFEDVFIPEEQILGALDGGSELLRYTLSVANIALSAELLGLSLEAFERTVEYLKTREQFGKPIGSFQALQHRAAQMLTELELSKSLVMNALSAIDERNADLSRIAAGCKAKLCLVAKNTTNEAIQLHGGIGMTDEFDIGFFIKRSRVAEQTFGDYSYQIDQYALLSGY